MFLMFAWVSREIRPGFLQTKRRELRKDLTTSLFVSKPQYLLCFSQGRCLVKRSLNTSPITSFILLFLHLDFL